MRSTMPDYPLTLQHFLWHSRTLFPDKEIVSRRDEGTQRYRYRDLRISSVALESVIIGPVRYWRRPW